MIRQEMVDRLFQFDIQFIQLRHALMEEARPKTVTPLQFQILLYLHCEEECTMGQLSKCLNLAPSNSSREVKKMCESGLLVRTVSSEDKRSSSVSLSEAGAREVKDAYQKIRAAILKKYASLSDEDVAEIVEGFQKLGKLFR